MNRLVGISSAEEGRVHATHRDVLGKDSDRSATHFEVVKGNRTCTGFWLDHGIRVGENIVQGHTE